MRIYLSIKQLLSVINALCLNNKAKATIVVSNYYLDNYFTEHQYGKKDIIEFLTDGYLDILTLYTKICDIVPEIKTSNKWYTVSVTFDKDIRLIIDSEIPYAIFDEEEYNWYCGSDAQYLIKKQDYILKKGQIIEFHNVLF